MKTKSLEVFFLNARMIYKVKKKKPTQYGDTHTHTHTHRHVQRSFWCLWRGRQVVVITWSKSINTTIFNYMSYKLQEENCSLLVQIYHTIAHHTCLHVQLITVLHLETHWSCLTYNCPFFSFDSSVRRNEKKKENEERICGSPFF